MFSFLLLIEYVKISTIADCDDVVYLTTIYGTIIGGAVIGFSVCLAALLVMVNSVSWKNPWKVGGLLYMFSSSVAKYRIFFTGVEVKSDTSISTYVEVKVLNENFIELGESKSVAGSNRKHRCLLYLVKEKY